VFDKSTVFLDHLPWPTAVFCCNGGVLVGACPDIIFAKDTDGDGVADDVKTLFTGFGTEEKLNVQGLFNNFIWGLDNRIHGCSGHDGGLVRSASTSKPAAPPRDPLDVRNKGFVIDPRDWSMTTEAGGGQYGLSFDPTGRLFTCTNSSHCEMFMYDSRYAARNPYLTLPDPRISIAADGPAAEVFRISPEEPWRVIRTRWRVAGLVGGPIEGGGRSAGYFTGATGITIYKGDAFGPDYVGDAFIGDAGGNLVHHKRIRPGPDGIEPVAQRPDDEKKIEFVASSDNWFRPVDFANAPDGCLYICDMYREVIEHPWSIPPQIKKFLDLNSGNDRGRIYRIAPDGWKPRRPPRFSEAGIADLVKALEHPNGWHRDTAARLIHERHDRAATPLLRDLLHNASASSLGRLHATHALARLDQLTEADVRDAMNDTDPIVRAHAVLLSERFIDGGGAPSAARWQAYARLAGDSDARVRYQLAFTLGLAQHEQCTQLLCDLLIKDPDSKWMRVAVLSSVAYGAGDAFVSLATSERFVRSPSGRHFLMDLGGVVGAMNKGDDIQRVVKSFPPDSRWELTRALADGIARTAGVSAVRSRLGHELKLAHEIAVDSRANPSARIAAIALLGYLDFYSVQETLYGLLHQSRESAQLAALSALDRYDDEPAVGTIVVGAFPDLAPRARTEAAAILLKRPERAIALLNAIHDRKLRQSDLDASQVNQLLAYRADAAVRTLARSTLKAPTTNRADVVEAMRPALSLAGDAAKGKLLCEQRCLSCHRATGEGNAVGPDLVTVKNAGREKLLFNILDPNREVAPQYVAYLIETKDGHDVLGMLASDTPAAIVVRQAYGKETAIARSNIKRMTSQGKSLMPEGLEVGLTPQDLADLIAFVESAK
jgi:putative membrane-bound dehydrogenase-like protein